MALQRTRTARRRWPFLVGAALVVALLATGASALVHRGPTRISLVRLVDRQESYAGRDVETAGTVRRFVDPDGSTYYVIEDSPTDRVEIEPAGAASGHVGQRVAVVGTFRVDDRTGRSIAVRGLSPVGP